MPQLPVRECHQSIAQLSSGSEQALRLDRHHRMFAA